MLRGQEKQAVAGRADGVEVGMESFIEYLSSIRETFLGPAGHVLDGYWSPDAVHDDGSRIGPGKKLLEKAARRDQVIQVLEQADQGLAIRL
jgi:hypothetical protein